MREENRDDDFIADSQAPADAPDGRREDFVYDLDTAKFWHVTINAQRVKETVDASIPTARWATDDRGRMIPPHRELMIRDNGHTVEGSTWWPGKPNIIKGYAAGGGGLLAAAGTQCYNRYRDPPPGNANGKNAEAWVEHVKMLYPDPEEHEHFFDWAAHAVQRPDIKCNHGVVLAGKQGIGKDLMLMPLRAAAGDTNTSEIGPDEVFERFNAYARARLIIINEVRPQDSHHKASTFYERLKPLLASPPAYLSINEKGDKPYAAVNVCRVVLTTNSPLDLYMPPEDRRLFVMTSEVAPREPAYYKALWDELRAGVTWAAVEWLAARDLSGFDAAGRPPMTAGKEEAEDVSTEVRWTAADDVLSAFIESHPEGKPRVIFSADLRDFVATSGLFDNQVAYADALKSKAMPHRMAALGYARVPHPSGAEWKRGKFRSRSAYLLKPVPRIVADRVKCVDMALWIRGGDLPEDEKERMADRIASALPESGVQS